MVIACDSPGLGQARFVLSLSVCCYGDVLLWLRQVVHLDWDKLDSFSHVVVVTPKSISPVC